MIPTAEGEVSFVFARHRFAYEWARQFVAGKDVLDIGCGTGYGCKILSESASSVLGIDYSAEAIEFCRKKFSASNIEYVQMDASQFKLNRQFDVAVSFQVIEHLQHPDTFLDRIKDVMRPSGKIIITTPNVRVPTAESNTNPFHFNEMNYQQFYRLLQSKLDTFDLYGIGYASPNRLRRVVQSFPLYRQVGKLFKRANPVKKIAGTAMNMTSFTVLTSDVARDAIDLLAICVNE